jgi:hypothetical protein
MDLRVVPAQCPYGRLATTLGGADRDVGGHARKCLKRSYFPPRLTLVSVTMVSQKTGRTERAASGAGLVRRAATGEAARRRRKC